jgi:hypothetical protein
MRQLFSHKVAEVEVGSFDAFPDTADLPAEDEDSWAAETEAAQQLAQLLGVLSFLLFASHMDCGMLKLKGTTLHFAQSYTCFATS